MLIRRRGLAEPAVIRYHDEQFGTHLRELPHQIRENTLVADRRRNLVSVHLTDRVPGSGYKLTHLACQAFGKEKQVLERNIFSERNQVHFVIAGKLDAVRTQERGAVRWLIAGSIDVSDEEIGTELSCDLLHTCAESRIGEVERRWRFWPDDESWPAGVASGEGSKFVHQLIRIGLFPGLVQRNVSLDETNGDRIPCVRPSEHRKKPGNQNNRRGRGCSCLAAAQ